MCPQLPGSFTSSMPATVIPRNTSSETSRSLGLATRWYWWPDQLDGRPRAVPSGAVTRERVIRYRHRMPVCFTADVSATETERRMIRVGPLELVIRDEERREVA